jgi:phosphatidylethanolamine-binding protein (PEBP) family uncharacterized protein
LNTYNPNNLEIEYDGEVFKSGETLNRERTSDAPSFEFDAKSQKYYTLIMFDPDTPSPEDPFMSEYIHLLLINIYSRDKKVRSFDTLFTYERPSPLPGTGIHRFVFYLYEQAKHYETFKSPKLRMLNNISTITKDNNLDNLVGSSFYLQKH